MKPNFLFRLCCAFVALLSFTGMIGCKTSNPAFIPATTGKATSTTSKTPIPTYPATYQPLPSPTATLTADPTLSENDREAEEYAVYSALIETGGYIRADTELVVIEDHTYAVSGLGSSAALQRVKPLVPQLTQEVISDFDIHNEQSRLLNPLFNLSVPYVLISDDEVQEIFQGSKGWDRFYARYPDSQGKLALSRVGFNSEMDDALVFADNVLGELIGEGAFVFLTKENDLWTIIASVRVWVR